MLSAAVSTLMCAVTMYYCNAYTVHELSAATPGIPRACTQQSLAVTVLHRLSAAIQGNATCTAGNLHAHSICCSIVSATCTFCNRTGHTAIHCSKGNTHMPPPTQHGPGLHYPARALVITIHCARAIHYNPRNAVCTGSLSH